MVNATFSPGDIEELKEIIEAFGLEPVVLPDVSGSLDGHLEDADFSPLTTGGTDVENIRSLGDARATIVVGNSLTAAADILAERTGVPDHRFDHLMGLEAVDVFIHTLQQVSGCSVPPRFMRQRKQLQDAMLDVHFYTGMARIALAGDPDFLKAYGDLITGTGARIVTAVAPANARVLKSVPSPQVKIGDLEELEKFAREAKAGLVIGNAHCAATAERLGVPLLRAGFPQFDRFGAPAEISIGYRGTRRVLYDVANLLLETEPGAVPPYRSIYAPEMDSQGVHP